MDLILQTVDDPRPIIATQLCTDIAPVRDIAIHGSARSTAPSRGLKLAQIDHTVQRTGKIDLNQRGQYSVGQGVVTMGSARTQARVILESYAVAVLPARRAGRLGRPGSPLTPKQET
jgi:hypothetical protein